MTQNSQNSQNQIKHTETQNNASNTSEQYQYQVYGNNSKQNHKVVTGYQYSQDDQQLKEEKNEKQLLEKVVQNKPTNKLYTNTRVIQSDNLEQYINYFSDVETKADYHIKLCLQNIAQTCKHKIVVINNNYSQQLVSFSNPTITISGNLYGGIIVKYEIIVGNYRLKVDLLNIQKNASNNLLKIGYGGYGSIYRIKYSKIKTIVAKRILFKSQKTIKFEEKQIIPNRVQIHESLYQYSIYKICSFYKIGPQIANELGFDVVCFSNCLQFYMEECLRGKYIFNTIQNDLKLCLRILHKIKIVHKDVKPANILYSYSQNRYVLCDFGISHPVEEQIGFKSKTYKQGSPGFMSPQMQKIARDHSSYVDLYYNDLYGLKCSVNEFINHYQIREKCLSIQRLEQQQLEDILSIIKQTIYQSIYLFKLYLMLKSNTNYLSGYQQKLYLNKQNVMLTQIFQIYLKEQVTTIGLLIDKIDKFHNGNRLQYLIRCYGLKIELLYELNKLKPTEQTEKLKRRIKEKKQNNFISEQKLKKFKGISHKNRYEFSLERQVVYYKYLQKQLNTSFKEKILNILLEIFYTKIQTVQDYSTFLMIIQKIRQILTDSNIEKKQEIFVFDWLAQIIMRGDSQQKNQNYLRLSYQFYPNSQQKVYTYLIRYNLVTLDNNNQIIKYGKKLQKFYKQNEVYIESYLWLVCQLATAYQKINKRISMHYFEELRLYVNFYLKQLSQQHQSQVINCYRYLGIYYEAYNSFQQALKYYEKQLWKIKYFYGDYEIEEAKCYIRMGRCLYRLGKLQEAEKDIKLALEIINFNSYYQEYSRMQYQCNYLMCLICLISQKQQMLMDYYYGLIQNNIQRRKQKLQQDNEILFDNNLKRQHNKLDGFLNHKQSIRKCLITQNREEAKKFLSNMEMQFQIKFIHHRKQRLYLSQLVQESEKNHKKSKFLLQKLIALQSNQQSLNLYIEQKLKFVLISQQMQYNDTLFLMQKAIQFQEKSTLNNYLLINQVYTKICIQWQLTGNIQRCIQYCKKRVKLIINHRQQFDKQELIKCFFKLKNYFLMLRLYTEAIYYFNTLMSIYHNAQIYCIYDILCDFYLLSGFFNYKAKAYNCKLKYYITKRQKEKEKYTKYTELKQLCEVLHKRSIIQLIDQYCIQFNFLENYIYHNKLNKDQYYEHFESLQSCKKWLYLKRKTKLFRLNKVSSIRQTMNQKQQILI